MHSIKILRVITRLNVGGPARHAILLTSNLNKGIFESKLIAGLLNSQRTILRASPGNATKIIVKKTEFDAVEQAAWIVVCRTVLNLDEFMTRE